uniref:Uncharacterized protein n=1 Tax=Arundo donax TaxID=35708 RepID=A0A0A8YPM6_ARUDO
MVPKKVLAFPSDLKNLDDVLFFQFRYFSVKKVALCTKD